MASQAGSLHDQYTRTFATFRVQTSFVLFFPCKINGFSATKGGNCYCFKRSEVRNLNSELRWERIKQPFCKF